MTQRDALIFALTGFVVWLVGAVMFRFGGHWLFESGPWVLLAASVSTGFSVCFLLNATMAWRKAPAESAVLVAVIMALPGLFGDAAYALGFHAITGLDQASAGAFAALVIVGNAERGAVGHVGDSVGFDNGFAILIPPDLAGIAMDDALRHRL